MQLSNIIANNMHVYRKYIPPPPLNPPKKSFKIMNVTNQKINQEF